MSLIHYKSCIRYEEIGKNSGRILKTKTFYRQI